MNKNVGNKDPWDERYDPFVNGPRKVKFMPQKDRPTKPSKINIYSVLSDISDDDISTEKVHDKIKMNMKKIHDRWEEMGIFGRKDYYGDEHETYLEPPRSNTKIILFTILITLIIEVIIYLLYLWLQS